MLNFIIKSTGCFRYCKYISKETYLKHFDLGKLYVSVYYRGFIFQS